MKLTHISAFAICAVIGLSACNKADSPDKVQADVAKATQDASASDAKADDARKQAETQSNQDMAKAKADAQTQAVDKQIGAVADQAVTETEGQTTIALAKCKALEGDAQKQCKDQATAHLQEVKDRASTVKKNLDKSDSDKMTQ